MSSSLVQRHESLRRAAKLAVDDSVESLSEQVLTEVVLQTIKKYQQKLNVGIEDSITDLLDNFKQKITETIFEAATWRVAVRSPFLFPRNCRFCYVRGHSTIVVIEQEPQIRSLLLSSKITGMIREESRTGDERLGLAFPYVVFVLHFRDDTFSGMYTGWRRSALSSLDDMLSRPLLPNIHDNLNVCMGHAAPPIGSNISDRSENVVSNFWNSQFNDDLSANWWAKQSYHRDLESAHRWSNKSEEDPTFILQVSFREEKSVQYIIDLLTLNEEQPDESNLRHVLSEKMDNCVELLFSKIMRYFKKTKFEKHFPKDVSDQVKTSLEGAVGDYSDLLLCLDHEIKELSKLVRPAQKVKMVKTSGVWHPYST